MKLKFNSVTVDIKDHLSLQLQSKEDNILKYEGTLQSVFCFQSSISHNNTFQCFAITAIEQGVLDNKPDSSFRPICVHFTILILLRQLNQINSLYH